jgi:hypothetical protein
VLLDVIDYSRGFAMPIDDILLSFTHFRDTIEAENLEKFLCKLYGVEILTGIFFTVCVCVLYKHSGYELKFCTRN